jgi:WD40 repeat protein
VALSADSSKVAVAEGLNLYLYELRTGKRTALPGHSSFVHCIAFSADGRRLLTGGEDRLVRLWDTATGEELFALAGHQRDIIAGTFSRDGRKFATFDDSGLLLIWRDSFP